MFWGKMHPRYVHFCEANRGAPTPGAPYDRQTINRGYDLRRIPVPRNPGIPVLYAVAHIGGLYAVAHIGIHIFWVKQ